MSTFLLFSEEGVVLITKSSTFTPKIIEYSGVAKYLCLSFALWRDVGKNRSTKEIRFGGFKALVREIHLRNSVCFVALLIGEHGTLDQEPQSCRDMALRKLCSTLSLGFNDVLDNILNKISASIKNALQMGTFSDSMEASDDIEDLLINDDDFQDAKAEVEKSLLEPFLDSPTFNCDTIVNDLQVLRSDHNFICESISYRSDTSCEEPWIQLYSTSFVTRSNHYDSLYNKDTTEDLAIMQCNTFDDDEFSAILLIQKRNFRASFSVPTSSLNLTDSSHFGAESITNVRTRQVLLRFTENCFDWLQGIL